MIPSVVAVDNPSVDINVRDENGDTPLHSAARTGIDVRVASLIAYGADVAAKNNLGNTPRCILLYTLLLTA